MMCMGLKDCTTGYWDKGGGGICRLFGVPGAKKKKCKIDARRSKDYTVIKCAKGGGAAKKKAAKKKAPEKKKKAAAPKKKSSSSSKKSGAVYVTTKIIFGK